MRNINFLFCIAIVSLLIIITIIINTFYPHFGFPIQAEQTEIDKINNTVLSLATSYITGYLIYYITIVVQNKKRQKVYDQFIKDIIYQFYFDTLLQYNKYYFEPDEYVADFRDFSNKNEKYISYILNTTVDESKLSLTETLKMERKLFFDEIINFFEYMTVEQLEMIEILRTTDLISQIDVVEFAEQKDYESEESPQLEFKVNYAPISKVVFEKYVKLIIGLKNTI